MQVRLDTFKAAYYSALGTLQEAETGVNPNSDYGWLYGADSARLNRCVDKMTAGVIEDSLAGNKHDWLKHNKAMRMAAKACGITSSPQLREQALEWGKEDGWQVPVDPAPAVRIIGNGN